MSTRKAETFSAVNRANGIQMRRSSSPVPSYVSMKSDRSMKMPVNYNERSELPEESFQLKRSSSPVPSDISLKSDRSMKMPVNYNGRAELPEKSFQLRRPSSPVPSDVSLKSDRSMKMPVNYDGRPEVPEKSFQLRRSSSSDPSAVSLKSDRSVKMPINFNNEPLSQKDSFQLRRANSSGPSAVSLKSDCSVKIPINFNNQPLSQKDRHDSNRSTNEKLKSICIQRYQHLFEGTAQQGTPIFLNKIYTELYITEDMSYALQGHHEVNHIEAALKTITGDTPIKCNNIFKPLPEEHKPIRTVLTKGVAGIGKTVSVQKFILDWAEGKANQDVHFIFPLPFREMNLMRDQKYSLNDLLQHFFMGGIDASSLEATNHSLVFIFDGLDECRLPLDFQNNECFWDATKTTSVDVLLTNLIKGNLLPSAKIWITSRPAASGRIPAECVDRVTEVRGFDDPQREEYFRKRITDRNLADKIITHVKSLRSLYVMCQIPVFCWIAATVLEGMVVDFGWDKIPKGLTQMYTYFLITQINTKKTKYSDNKEKDKEMIFKLGKLAFEQLQKGNLIFYEEDLRECGIDIREASVYSGVFTQIFKEEFGLFQRKVFSFVHLSIQEHLAALYVFLSFHNDNRNVLDPNHKEPVTMFSVQKTAIDKAYESESGHLDLFIRFLVGFLLESNQSLLQDLLVQRCRSPGERTETISYLKKKINENLCAHLSVRFFHCLNELNDSSLVDEIQSFLTKTPIIEENLSNELWSALVFIILTSYEKLDEFELCRYGKSDKALFCLSAVIKLSRIARMLSSDAEKICFLDSALSLNPSVKREPTLIWDEAAYMVYHLIEIMSQTFGRTELPGLSGTPCSIEMLRLKKCGVTRVGCDFLASVLSSDTANLKELTLSQNDIGDSGFRVIADVLKRPSCKLDTLKVNNCKLTEHSCTALASALQANSVLKTVSLSNNDIQDSGVKLLATGLKDPQCKLETLGLKECGITEKSCACLASLLSSEYTCLRELDLSMNDMKDSGAKLLSAGVGHPNCKLENLIFQLRRSNSSSPSAVSLKSDGSMKMPLNYNREPWPPKDSLQLRRPNSPGPSAVSLKSDGSMKMPLNYNREPWPPKDSFQLRSSNSAGPTTVSLKSDISMKMPINYNSESWPPKDRHDSSTLNENLKFICMQRYQHLFEGTAQQGTLIFLNKIYTELYITVDMNNALQGHHEVNHIEATLKTITGDTPIKCNNIFKPLPEEHKPVRTVLTKGVAGIGKTISVQKFILDWAEGKANQDVHFIFPLPFREMNLMREQKYSLNDLLQHFFIGGIDASSLEATNHSLVFIFDGLDECRLPLDFQNNECFWNAAKTTSVDVLLTNLIKGNLLPSAKIWITSRPAASGRIPAESVDRVTEVRGFDDPQKEEYFRKRITDRNLANKIITHVKSLRSLHVMCHIPVFCWIAATVLERMVRNYGKSDKALFRLGGVMKLSRIARMLNSVAEKRSFLDLALSLSPSAKREPPLIWDETAQMLYSLLEAMSQKFGMTELPGLRGTPCTIEMLRLKKCGVTRVGCDFLASVLSSDISKLKELTLSQNDIGDSGFKVIADVLKRPSCKLDTLKVNNCKLTEHSCTALASALQANSVLKTVSLSNNDIQDSGVKLLAAGLKDPQCKLETLGLSNCNLRLEGFTSLTSAIRSNPSYLRVLNLSKNKPGDLGVKLLFGVLESPHCSFERLKLKECGITEKSCACLASLLSSEYTCLRELDLSMNDLKESGAKLLSGGVGHPNCKLENLMLQNCRISDKGCAALYKVLKSNPS
ncbi:hypothetical protein NFI96_007102 [Prochilodus magdalenae]|nr:hypothetical protein NFI96_007102 [Prochilodus magdalenae]